MDRSTHEPYHYQVLPDEEVVHLANNGDKEAAEVLLCRYRGLIENKARSFFVRGADREDVVQEGMIGLYKAIKDYRQGHVAKFQSFADLCVTRQIISAVKAATRNKHNVLNASVSFSERLGHDVGDATLQDVIPDPSANPEEALLEDRAGDRLMRHARHCLSQNEMQILRGYLDGKSYQELSAELHCTTKTIDNALQRMKRKMSTSNSA